MFTQSFSATFNYITSGDSNWRKSRKFQRADACSTVFYANHMKSFFNGYSHAHSATFRIEPRVWFGRKLAECANITLSQRKTSSNDGIIKNLRVVYIQMSKDRNNRRPCFFIQSRSD